MANVIRPKLNPKKSYLQIALNSTLEEAERVIMSLPHSDRIIIEAGTPLIKRYGEEGIRRIKAAADIHALAGTLAVNPFNATLFKKSLSKAAHGQFLAQSSSYIVADLKTMDRAATEVEMASRAGASAAIALGLAPTETLNEFIETCERLGMDAMIDMMNVEYPLAVLHKLKKIPPIILIHRGVDEERLNREKQIPLHEIRRIKGMYDVMISIAGGDTIREVQRSVFNDADIVVIWKSVYEKSPETASLVDEFLKQLA